MIFGTAKKKMRKSFIMHGVDDIDFYTIKSSVVHYADTVSHTIQATGLLYLSVYV